MLEYSTSIDTDAAIGTILSHFSTEYINHIVDDSLMIRFRPYGDEMPNLVDIKEREFKAILANSPDYVDQVINVQRETYKEIIMKICNFYNLSFHGDFDSIDNLELYGIARTLYDIFVSRFTDYMINFFVSYIVNNSDSIYSYLTMDETAMKPKETGLYKSKNYIEPKYILIHANANKVIYNMAGYDIPFDLLISYLLDPNSATRINSLISDNGDIYKNYYACYILDQNYSAGTLTNIKLRLQAKTQEINAF